MRFPEVTLLYTPTDNQDVVLLSFNVVDETDVDVYYRLEKAAQPASARMAAPLEGYTLYTTPVEVSAGDKLSYYMEKDGIQSDVVNHTITESDTTGVENVTVGTDENVEYFNLQGVRVANPGSGVYIRRQGNTVSKVTLR